MNIHKITAFAFIFLCVVIGLAKGQTPVKASPVTGEVVSISDKKLVVNTKSGPVDVMISEKTAYKRLSAEKPDFQTAALAAFSDIAAGDKVIVSGMVATDGTAIPARNVYLMTK